MAQIAAALGRQFSHELISAVTGMAQQQLENALDQLVAAELIFRRGTPPDAEYTFKHALVQDAAYSTLLKSRRQQMHARIAKILEEQFPDVVTVQPELLAQHYAEAGLTGKSVTYWLNAGQQSIARWAMTEAVAQLRKGLDLLASVPDEVAHRQQELNLQISLGNALLATKGYAAPEAGEAFARARQLCDQLIQSPQLGVVMVGQLTFRMVRGDLEQAERHAKELRQLWETRNDEMWKLVGLRLSGAVYCFLGKFIDARANCENALSLADSKLRAMAGAAPEDPHVSNLLYLSRALLCLGYLDQARLRRDEALAEARRLSPYNIAYSLCLAWYCDCLILGTTSAQEILPSADEVIAISNEKGFPLWLAVGNIMRCRSFLRRLAEVYGISGQWEEALARLDEAAHLVETTQERWTDADRHRLRGALLLPMNDPAPAEECYRQALAVAREQNAKFWELRAATSLARLWRDQGKRTDARDLLAPVYGWFTEGFDTLDLKEAKALLDELNA